MGGVYVRVVVVVVCVRVCVCSVSVPRLRLFSCRCVDMCAQDHVRTETVLYSLGFCLVS